MLGGGSEDGSEEDGVQLLVVAADPAERRMIQEVGESRGYRVEACAAAGTAWQIFRRDLPPVVILDHELGNGHGLDLCRKIRGLPDPAGSLVVMVTANSEPEVIERALEAGADDWVARPLSEGLLNLRLAIAERRAEALRRQNRSEQKLVYEALHDPLTDLSRRSVLMDRLERAIRSAKRRRSHLFALLFLELDDFDTLHRELGSELSDRLLVEVSRRLEECVRSVDTIARLGSSQFAILLDELRDVTDPTRVSSRIHLSLSQPFRLGGDGQAFCSASIGITLSLTGSSDGDELLRNAHEAMTWARGQGPGRHQMFDPVMNARVVARVQLESKLRLAVEQEKMAIRYQPIVDLASNRILGFEALIHWQDVEQGTIPPEDFVPVAEQTGLIHLLGWRVFRQACKELGEWQKRFPSDPPLTVSVNVSGHQFSEPDVLDQVDEALESSGVAGESVHLEITESVLMENAEATYETLTKLKQRAVHLHVDDFGTGYSSLSYLCRFPIDALKIDRSFIRQMAHSPENLEVVRTIVRLAKNLGMVAIAEGVETDAELDTLRRLECDAGQGYLFSATVDAEGAVELLEKDRG